MKKKIIYAINTFLMLFMCIFLFGCGKSKPVDTPKSYSLLLEYDFSDDLGVKSIDVITASVPDEQNNKLYKNISESQVVKIEIILDDRYDLGSIKASLQANDKVSDLTFTKESNVNCYYSNEFYLKADSKIIINGNTTPKITELTFNMSGNDYDTIVDNSKMEIKISESITKLNPNLADKLTDINSIFISKLLEYYNNETPLTIKMYANEELELTYRYNEVYLKDKDADYSEIMIQGDNIDSNLTKIGKDVLEKIKIPPLEFYSKNREIQIEVLNFNYDSNFLGQDFYQYSVFGGFLSTRLEDISGNKTLQLKLSPIMMKDASKELINKLKEVLNSDKLFIKINDTDITDNLNFNELFDEPKKEYISMPLYSRPYEYFNEQSKENLKMREGNTYTLTTNLLDLAYQMGKDIFYNEVNVEELVNKYDNAQTNEVFYCNNNEYIYRKDNKEYFPKFIGLALFKNLNKDMWSDNGKIKITTKDKVVTFINDGIYMKSDDESSSIVISKSFEESLNQYIFAIYYDSIEYITSIEWIKN